MKKALVILSYNHLEQTQQCLRSIAAYFKSSERWPMILIHNGSRPDIVARLQQDWPHIDHSILPENVGYAGGMNAGLSHAFMTYDCVVALSNDTLLHQLPNSLPSGIGVPIIYRRSTKQIDSCGGYLNLWNGRLRHLHTPAKFDRWVQKATFYVPGAAFSIDRESWQLLGGFDENLFCYWEDVELSLRAHKLKLPIHLLENLSLIHKIGKTTRKKPYYTSYLFQRNRRIVLQRFARSPWQRLFQGLSLILQDWRRVHSSLTQDSEKNFWYRQRHNLGSRLPENSYSLVKTGVNR